MKQLTFAFIGLLCINTAFADDACQYFTYTDIKQAAEIVAKMPTPENLDKFMKSYVINMENAGCITPTGLATVCNDNGFNTNMCLRFITTLGTLSAGLSRTETETCTSSPVDKSEIEDLTFVQAVPLSNQRVKYATADGRVYLLSGTLPWRTNNPGSLRNSDLAMPGVRVKGGSGTFAAFKNSPTGFQAMRQLLRNRYNNMSILATMKKYAPASDGNNPTKYANTLVKALKKLNSRITTSTKISQLTNDELQVMAAGIARHEGFLAQRNKACLLN